jgi:hypothetical protein
LLFASVPATVDAGGLSTSFGGGWFGFAAFFDLDGWSSGLGIHVLFLPRGGLIVTGGG